MSEKPENVDVAHSPEDHEDFLAKRNKRRLDALRGLLGDSFDAKNLEGYLEQSSEELDELKRETPYFLMQIAGNLAWNIGELVKEYDENRKKSEKVSERFVGAFVTHEYQDYQERQDLLGSVEGRVNVANDAIAALRTTAMAYEHLTSRGIDNDFLKRKSAAYVATMCRHMEIPVPDQLLFVMDPADRRALKDIGRPDPIVSASIHGFRENDIRKAIDEGEDPRIARRRITLQDEAAMGKLREEADQELVTMEDEQEKLLPHLDNLASLLVPPSSFNVQLPQHMNS
jgi:hypothetical protein